MNVNEILKKYRSDGVKVDLGCGQNKNEGFLGIDIEPHKGVDIVWDLEEYPWPLPDECAELVVASHLVEHIEPHKGNFIKFMNEAWRILKVGGKFMIACPYAGSPGFYQDPTHCNPINEVTWTYFDPLNEPTQGMLYRIYHPKPWKILQNTWMEIGNMEVALEKRKEDKSYV
jgi:predicted SAM-dependent methyltransferase